MTKLYVNKLDVNASVPTKATEFSAGLDLFCHIPEGTKVKVFGSDNVEKERYCSETGVVLYPNETALVPTGLVLACDPGWCIKAYPRSGKSVKQKLSLINCVALIDADYQKQMFIAVVNHSTTSLNIINGEALCQIMVEQVPDVDVVVDGPLPDLVSKRSGGFGSTGN